MGEWKNKFYTKPEFVKYVIDYLKNIRRDMKEKGVDVYYELASNMHPRKIILDNLINKISYFMLYKYTLDSFVSIQFELNFT